jgi:hypothetical protein
MWHAEKIMQLFLIILECQKFVGRNKKRSAAIANDEKKIHIKQERRNEALAEILVAIE